MSRQFLFLIPMATAGVALLLSTGLSLAVSSTYTDVESCRSHDTEWDELLCLCDGPDGLAGILHYVEGKAFTVFGKSGGKSEIDDPPVNADDDPIAVGGESKIFGPTIEWVRSDGGEVCAAIVRVSTKQGSSSTPS